MMDALTTHAHAKINWTLRVIRRRDDGYHDIETVFQTISLHDTLEFRTDKRTRLFSKGRRIPTDRRNLVMAAVERLREAAPFGHVRIRLVKRIPVGGGLGGGSSDAATTLVALTRMFGLAVPRSQLFAIAASLGSDVPFFLHGGTAWAGGRGERLEALPSVGRLPLLLVLPRESMSTREAYAALRRTAAHGAASSGAEAWERVVKDGILRHAASLENDFEAPFFAKYPALRQWKVELVEAGASIALLSGSGSTIFGAFDSVEARDAAARDLGGKVRVVAADTLPASPFDIVDRS